MLSFEVGTKSSIFSLEIKKRQTSVTNLISSNQETPDSTANRNVKELFESIVHSKVTDNILFYISGYMIRNFVTNIDFQDCVTSMPQPAVSNDYQYSATLYVIFLYRKSKISLSQASYGSYIVVVTAEKAFKLNIINTQKMY